MASTQIVFGSPYEDQLPEASLESYWDSDTGEIVGQPYDDKLNLRMLIVKEVIDKMWAHVNETPKEECAGVLAGQAYFDRDKQLSFTVITDIVRNNTPERGIGHVHISAESARIARQQIEEMGLRPVGWYHSHPVQGIFLSGDDMQIVRGIYNASWHIALVFDPLEQEFGAFQGGLGRRMLGWLELDDSPFDVSKHGNLDTPTEMIPSEEISTNTANLEQTGNKNFQVEETDVKTTKAKDEQEDEINTNTNSIPSNETGQEGLTDNEAERIIKKLKEYEEGIKHLQDGGYGEACNLFKKIIQLQKSFSNTSIYKKMERTIQERVKYSQSRNQALNTLAENLQAIWPELDITKDRKRDRKFHHNNQTNQVTPTMEQMLSNSNTETSNLGIQKHENYPTREELDKKKEEVDAERRQNFTDRRLKKKIH